MSNKNRQPREWYIELPLDGSPGQVFTDSRQLTKGGELVKVREVIEESSIIQQRLSTDEAHIT